jgi:hypothetical protein
MKTKFLLLCVAAAALTGPVSRAEVRTFAMEGMVSYKNDPLNMIDWVDFGDRMVYTFSFDSETPDLNPLTSVAEYEGLSATLRVADTSIAVTPPRILIGNTLDIFRLHSDLTLNSSFGDAFLTLSDQADRNALTDTSLPTVPYDLAPWELKHFDFGIDIPQSGYPPVVTLTFGGNIDAFYIVPEPVSMALLLLGSPLVGRGHSNPSCGAHPWRTV